MTVSGMMRVRELFCALVLGILASCAPPVPQAAESEAPGSSSEEEAALPALPIADGTVLNRISSTKTLRVGMTGEQPPFNMTSVGGELFGLEVDLARALATSLGVEVVLVTKPFGELLPAVESGDLDMALSSITMTPKRNLSVAFVGPYFISGKALLTKSETLAAAKKGAELNRNSLKLAALKGSTSQEFVMRAAPDAKLTPVDAYSDGVAAVASGKVDAMVADLPLVAVTLLRSPEAGFVGVGDPLSFEPIGIAIRAGDAHFVNLVTNYMTLLEGTGVLEALRQKWLGSGEWLRELPPESFGKPLDPGSHFLTGPTASL